MSVLMQAPATDRQLRYLRALADRTGTTFPYPLTRAQASREIGRLRASPRAAELPTDERPVAYGTAVHEHEVDGFGSSATWRVSAPPARSARPPRSERSSLELARYTVSGGERVLELTRREGSVHIHDLPGSGRGRAYVVERELDSEEPEALQALLADYLAQAEELDEVPMAGAAVRQILTTGSAHV